MADHRREFATSRRPQRLPLPSAPSARSPARALRAPELAPARATAPDRVAGAACRVASSSLHFSWKVLIIALSTVQTVTYVTIRATYPVANFDFHKLLHICVENSFVIRKLTRWNENALSLQIPCDTMKRFGDQPACPH